MVSIFYLEYNLTEARRNIVMLNKHSEYFTKNYYFNYLIIFFYDKYDYRVTSNKVDYEEVLLKHYF